MSALPQFSDSFGETHREPTLEEFTQDLAQANQFKPADIASNRNGFMSTRQFFRILWRTSKPLRQATWSLCLWVALLAIVFSLFRSKFARMLFFRNYAFEVIGLSFSIAMAFLVAMLHTTERTWQLLKDLLSGEVTSVEGRLHTSWQEELGEGFKRLKGEMVPTYYYSVRQENFEVQPEAHEILRSKYEDFRPKVRIYFTPRSRLLLSIETVDSQENRYRSIL